MSVKRRIQSLILAGALALALTLTAPTLAAGYKDLPESHWAYSDLMEASELGIIQGMGDGRMAPADTMSWGQFLTMITRAFAPDAYQSATDAGLAWDQAGYAAASDAGLLREEDALPVTAETLGSNISRQDAAVLLYTAPVFVVLMSAPLFGEKLSRRKLLAALVAFMGCAFVSGVVGGAGRLSFTGILFGLGSGIGYALYSIFGRYALERGYGSATISFYTFVFALIPTFLLADTGSAVSALTGSLGQFAFLSVLILMVTLAPYLLYTKGLQGLENGTASILASIEPVVATLVGLVIYSEKLGIWNILGIVLVLFSILLINRRSTEKKSGPEPDVKA